MFTIYYFGVVRNRKKSLLELICFTNESIKNKKQYFTKFYILQFNQLENEGRQWAVRRAGIVEDGVSHIYVR